MQQEDMTMHGMKLFHAVAETLDESMHMMASRL
jgi:hypothetical protein